MRAVSLAALVIGLLAVACGPKRPPRIDAPPPEYEAPQGFDEEDAGASDAETGN